MEFQCNTVYSTVNAYLLNHLENGDIEPIKSIIKVYEEGLSEVNTVLELINYLQIKEIKGEKYIIITKCLVSLLNRQDLINYLEMYECLIKSTLEIKDDDDFLTVYEKIIRTIENQVGISNAHDLKDDFKKEIASSRTLSQIQTIQQLLNILKERDALNDKDVSALEYILLKLNNQDLKSLVNAYVTLSNNLSQCEICGNDMKCIEWKYERNKINVSKFDELEKIALYLSIKVEQKKWKRLARVLELEEFEIQNIFNDEAQDTDQSKLITVINCWRSKKSNEASIEKLISVLESPTCKMISAAKDIREKKYL